MKLLNVDLLQPYLRFLLAPPKSKEESKEGEEESAKAVESSDSESEYDSDVDPGFVPPTSHDPDLDYDEYSDGEVPEEEQKSLLEVA